MLTDRRRTEVETETDRRAVGPTTQPDQNIPAQLHTGMYARSQTDRRTDMQTHIQTQIATVHTTHDPYNACRRAGMHS